MLTNILLFINTIGLLAVVTFVIIYYNRKINALSEKYGRISQENENVKETIKIQSEQMDKIINGIKNKEELIDSLIDDGL